MHGAKELTITAIQRLTFSWVTRTKILHCDINCTGISHQWIGLCRPSGRKRSPHLSVLAVADRRLACAHPGYLTWFTATHIYCGGNRPSQRSLCNLVAVHQTPSTTLNAVSNAGNKLWPNLFMPADESVSSIQIKSDHIYWTTKGWKPLAGC